MENRDPSSSSAARDAGPGEDDGMLTLRAGLAKDAALLFRNGRYAECVDVLKQLSRRKSDKKDNGQEEDDLKVVHNIALAEFFRDGCTDPRKLLHKLCAVKKKSDELAHTSGEHMETASSAGGSNFSGYKGGNSSLPNAPCTDEFDTSVVTVNTASVLYHLHEYKCALSILWPLYQNIEPIDEQVALRVCLLLLDVTLAFQDGPKAADVIQYLEKKSDVNGQPQSSNHGLKNSVAANSATAQENSGSDSSANANVSENAAAVASSDDAVEFENLYSTLDGGAQNLGRPPMSDLPRTLPDWVDPADIKLKINLCKVRLLLLTRNQKATKREVKLVMNNAHARDSSTALVLKSQLECSRGNHNKAMKLLQACGNRGEPLMKIILNCNYGCIHHQMGKHSLSKFYFYEALKTSSALLADKPWKLSTYSQNKARHVIYNCGLQSLVCGDSSSAASSFREAAVMFDHRPLFWLRSAECCLLALKKGQSTGVSSSNKDIEIHVIGSGRWRHLLIDDGKLRNRHPESTAQDDSLNGDKMMLSLPFAQQCLMKALTLLGISESKLSNPDASDSVSEESQTVPEGAKNLSQKNAPGGDSKVSNAMSSAPPNANDDSKETKGNQSINATLQSSVAAYAEMCRKENNMIKEAVLGDLAYVELCLDNHSKALAAAVLLQTMPGCSKIYKFLSRVYAAEALCHLKLQKEAENLLSVYLTDENNVDLPYSYDENEKWSTSKAENTEESKGSASGKAFGWLQESAYLKPEHSRGALYTNLAVMSAMQGDLVQASVFANKSLTDLPHNPRATLTAVYVDLKLGNAQNALNKLKSSRHIRFLPSR